MNLTERFGEAWCVTLTRIPPADALRAMGAAEIAAIPDLDGMSILAAREAAPGWTLVLQFDGTAGWRGAEPEVLRALAAGGGIAGSMVSDPNRTVVLFAGELDGGVDAVTGRRWGSPAVPAIEPGARHPAEAAALALQAATGVALSERLFDGGPWNSARGVEAVGDDLGDRQG